MADTAVEKTITAEVTAKVRLIQFVFGWTVVLKRFLNFCFKLFY